MRAEDWFGYFGRTTGDRELLETLQRKGFPAIPPIRWDRNDTRVERDGLMLEFLDLELYPDLAGGLGEGHGVLSAVTFVVAEKGRAPWTGALPFDLQPGDSQSALRERFGPPIEVNDTFCWDRWRVAGYDVTVEYGANLATLKLVTVRALARTGRAVG